MIENQHATLDIAKQVMSKELLRIILDSKQFDRRGYKIADRWSFNQPDLVSAMLEPILAMKLLDQQKIETEAMISDEYVAMLQQGMTEMEILQEMGINTQLTTEL